ncbi:hypothetical protein BDW66DRAFT_135261 [Aspergillus desertorum]
MEEDIHFCGENRNLLAFGSRPFLCPASYDFGPMVIGLLVGILLGVSSSGNKWVLGSDDAADMEEIHSRKRLKMRGVPMSVFLGACWVDPDLTLRTGPETAQCYSAGHNRQALGLVLGSGYSTQYFDPGRFSYQLVSRRNPTE